VTTPQDPEDEPAGDELPDEAPDAVSAEDALWRSIVANYGDRPEIAEPEVEVPPSSRDLPRGSEDDEVNDRPTSDSQGHYVPPEPPPLPKPPPARLLAWTGLFGVPTFVLVALVARLVLPSWLGLVLMVWFVGGFVFLVASMRPGPGEDHDDGARL
jgi:hypothetical protein